jgi:hypothetical protein
MGGELRLDSSRKASDQEDNAECGGKTYETINKADNVT